MTASHEAVLEVRNLETHIISRRGIGKAVDGVSFTVYAGRTLALIGESGSGKSMTAASILRLNPRPASRIAGGEVLFKGRDLLAESPRQMRAHRCRDIGYIPQEPFSSLDPVFSIGSQISEALRTHQKMRRAARKARSAELVEHVGIPHAAQRVRSYPHELSGGMRQRVLSAIAISCGPELVIADEPTTALDVTVQAEYLELLANLQSERNLGILFITHDFGIVANISSDVAVMYAGRIVEHSPTAELFASPGHPYTRGLIESLPDVSRDRGERLTAIPGQPPSIFSRSAGCPFAPRCPVVMGRCRTEDPPVVGLGPGHEAACWRLG